MDRVSPNYFRCPCGASYYGRQLIVSLRGWLHDLFRGPLC